MAATPVTPPDQRADAVALFDTVCARMPRIAEAIAAFTDPALRERAYYELVGILNPVPDEPEQSEQVELIADPAWGDGVELGSIAAWVADRAPIAWRESVLPSYLTDGDVIRFLDQGAAAWTQMLLVKHALMTAGGFTAEQVDGDLASLIREMTTDTPISPEIERLALHLQEEAQPGESAVDVAIRLVERLRSGGPALVPAADVGDTRVDTGLRREADRVDDREQP